MSLEDLEKSVLSDKPKFAVRSKPKAEPKAKAEPKKREAKEPKKKASKPEPVPEPVVVVPEPTPAPAPAPTKKGRAKKSSPYDLDDFKTEKKTLTLKSAAPISPKPKAAAAGSTKAAPNPFRNKIERPKAPPKAPSAPVEKDPNAGLVGLALGVAPLIAAPVFALSAARSALSSTASRRQEIQDKIDEAAAAKAAAKAAEKNTEVDGGDVFKALGFLGVSAGAAGFAILSSLTGSGLIDGPAAPAASSSVKTVAPAAKSGFSVSPPKFMTAKPIGSKSDTPSKAPKGYDLDGVGGKSIKQTKEEQKGMKEKAAAEKVAAQNVINEKTAERLAAKKAAAADSAKPSEAAAAKKAAAAEAAEAKEAAPTGGARLRRWWQKAVMAEPHGFAITVHRPAPPVS